MKTILDWFRSRKPAQNACCGGSCCKDASGCEGDCGKAGGCCGAACCAPVARAACCGR